MKRSLLFPLSIIFVAFVLFIVNFSPSTYFSGWDNLHPEFNFSLNIGRSIFAPWQEYQGLGLIGGMGHASDLPRQLLLLIFSIVLPENFLRQGYFFLMLLIGPLGMYFLLDKIILKQKFASLAGGLFYLLNLATIQTFFVAFEPFATQYGLLPWLIFAVFNYINHSSKRNLLFLITINLLAVPQAYVPTTFLVYFMVLIGSLIILSVQQKGEFIKKSLVVILITFLINAFWLLPFLYFTSSNIRVSVEAKMNQMATENVFLQNKEFGNIPDVVILKGFWFNQLDFNHASQKQDYLFLPWKEHFNNNLIPAIGFLLFGIILVGVIASFKQKNQYRWVLLFLFLVPIVILSNNTPPFSWIDNILYRFTFLAQALRSPYTKFSILAALSYSIFFAFGINLILNFIKSKNIKIFIFILAGGMMVIFTLPAFKGNLFYKQIKTNIPQDYYQMWNFFQSQNPNTRIANFPVQTFWGWTYYRWGYSGSGFLWYGLSQPILDRAFDVWSSTDENYYWEISYALYFGNKDLFEKVLQKYQISWLLVDNNVVYPASPKSLYINELKQLISFSDKIFLVQKFGQIEIYKTNFNMQSNNFVYLEKNLPKIEPVYKWNNLDLAYSENGDYVSDGKAENFNIYYPFRSLFTGKTQKDLEFSIEEKENYFIFRKILPTGLQNYNLETPEISNKDKVMVDSNDISKTRTLVENVSFDGQAIEVKVPKVSGSMSIEKNLGNGRELWLQDFPHNRGYLILVNSKNIQGKPLNFWIENVNSRKADLETYLPASRQGGPKTNISTTSFYIQPPIDEYGLGYNLHFDQGLFDDNQSKNELERVAVYPIPFDFLTGLKLKKGNVPVPSEFVPVKSDHSNPSFYRVEVSSGTNLDSATLVLSQSFDPGWVAFYYSGKFPLRQLTNHVLVNNWANGWELNPNQQGTIYIFFWPQLLEWGGLILLIGTFGFLLIKLIKKP